MKTNNRPIGIYRMDGVEGIEPYAQILDAGGSDYPIPESLYREQQYEPPFEALPTKDQHEAAKK